MDRPISRRDFLDGATMAAAVGCFSGTPGNGTGRTRTIDADDVLGRTEHPPELQGLRGDTPHTVGTAHALRDGRFWAHAGPPEDTGERYDLVVVGAGISGVAAAYRWWRADPGARILILDDHDDVGGHARCNEFRPRAGTGPLLGYGGSPYLPAALTPEAEALLRELGVDIRRQDERSDDANSTMYDGVFCDRETFGGEHRPERLLVFGPGGPDRIADLPMAPAAKADLIELVEDPPDWFPGLGDEAKKERLAGLTYAAFLRDVCRAHDDVIKFCRTLPCRDRACHADTLSAIDAWACARSAPGGHHYPGFGGLGLDGSAPSRYNARSVIRGWNAGPDIQYFPDGNHALIRMMIARMIPGAAGPGGPDHVRLDYGRLDPSGGRVRVRLSSPVVLTRNDGAGTATVGYFDEERVRTVRAGAVVMACWHGVIPYLVPDLPPDQDSALRQAIRTPLVYATVQLRQWRPWLRAGTDRVRFTGAYWAHAELAPRTAGSSDPERPINAHLLHIAARPGLPPRAGAAAGRRELIATPYHYLEYSVREQLTRLLGPYGFDPARDIEGLTINRWGHGRAIEYSRPFDRFYPDGPFPADIARRPFGRIAFAGSDSVPGPSVDTAVTAACRAVDELRA